MAKDSLSLIIPAYNEEKRILNTMSLYYNYLKKNFSDFELIVVSNGSVDKTPEIIKSFAKNKKTVYPLVFQQKLGKGGAIIEGFRLASKELVGFTDADCSVKPSDFNKLVLEMNPSCGAVIASRIVKGAKILKEQSFSRRFQGRVFRFLVNLFYGLNLVDTQCGAKIFHSNAIKKVLPTLKTKGFDFDIEILYKIKKEGFKIKEIGITWSDSNKSSVNNLDKIKMFFDLLRIRFIG
jgi:glycosyltransferase involved in cell wall biosynthesis